MKYEPLVMACTVILVIYVILETQISNKILHWYYSDDHVLCDIARICLIL